MLAKILYNRSTSPQLVEVRRLMVSLFGGGEEANGVIVWLMTQSYNKITKRELLRLVWPVAKTQQEPSAALIELDSSK